MTARSSTAALLGVVAGRGAVWPSRRSCGRSGAAPPPRPAFRIIELPSGRDAVVQPRETCWARPSCPGRSSRWPRSSRRSRRASSRPTRACSVRGRSRSTASASTCSHPDLGRPLGAGRSARAFLQRLLRVGSPSGCGARRSTARSVQLGLPPTSPSVSPVVASALGLDGTRIPATGCWRRSSG